MLISIPLILIFAFHFNVFLSATDSSQHIAPHTHLTLSQETAPPPIQKTNTPSTSISFSSPHSTSLALKQYQKDSLEVQSITWNEIQAICYNKTPDQLFNNFSYYANPYYLDLIRQKHGYEDFILNLHQRYTDDHDYRKSLRCIKGFYPYEFLKLIDTECDRIKTIQFEREQQKQLQLQKKLEATKHHCLQINNSSKYQNFIKQCEQDTYNAQILGNQNLINRYQKRIAAAQNALANPTLYDYSSHLKTYPVWNDPDAAVFNHRIGTALDQQLHEELCNTRLRMHELSFNTSTLEYKQHYAPIVYRCTALAKQEKNISIAFGLSDFSDAVVRILSRGIQFISHVSSGPIKGLKMIAQDVSSSKYWTELVTAMPNFIINVLPILLAHSPQLLKQGIIFAAHEQSFWDSLDQAYMRGDHELLEKQCKTYAEESRQQLKPIDDRFKQLASMSWEDIGKYGTYYGGRLILDAMACRAFTLAASTAGRELTFKITTLFESSTAPEKLAEVAGIGKVAIEEGSEFATNVLPSMMHNVEFVNSQILGNSISERLKKFVSKFKAKRINTLETGAFRGVRPKGDYDAWEVWAPAEYDRIRKCTSDVKKIAANTGFPEYKISRIKKHLFYDTHILDGDKVDRFGSSADIAASWNRLVQGDFIKNDLILLEHEYFESKFEKLFKTDYRTAHHAAKDSGRNWDPSLNQG